MASFKDGEGREWELKLNLGNLSRVKEKTGVNINDALKTVQGDGGKQTTALMMQIINDPFLLYSVVYTLIEPQLKNEGVSEENFAESLNDESIVSDIVEALNLAVIDFFPKGQRAALRKAFERLWSTGKKKVEERVRQGMEKIESLDLEAFAEKEFEKMFSNSAGSSEDSSESIPETSPSESLS